MCRKKKGRKREEGMERDKQEGVRGGESCYGEGERGKERKGEREEGLRRRKEWRMSPFNIDKMCRKQGVNTQDVGDRGRERGRRREGKNRGRAREDEEVRRKMAEEGS